MLAELLEDFVIINSVGEEMGKIKEVFLDLDTWMVSGLEISPGIFKKDRLIKMEDIVEIKYDEKKIVIKDDLEGSELPERPTKGMYPFHDLKKRPVVDKEGEKVGKVYNLEIPYEKLKKLKIWKLLIRTGFKERRLRISPDEVDKVMDDINLKMTFEEYKGKME